MSFGLGSLERNPMLRLLLRGKTTQHTLRRFLDEAPSDIHVHGRVRALSVRVWYAAMCWVCRWFCGRPIQYGSPVCAVASS